MNLQVEVNRLSGLVQALKACKSVSERLALLAQQPQVQSESLQQRCASLPPEEVVILHSLAVIGEWDTLCGLDLQPLLDALAPVEQFYDVLGGIVGYHHTLLTLLLEQQQPVSEPSPTYHPPVGVDLSVQQERYLIEGIASLPLLAEIYPVGGAADRLRLLDPHSGEALPAALLPFCGHTLLEGLIRDVQAREYLYFKLFHKQLKTPIAMMTSSEKNNHAHVIRLCQERGWWGRGEEAFRFFCQPPVPVIDPQGRWCVLPCGNLLMKPGGHGVLWKLARDSGTLDWMQQQGRDKMLVRQINNPIAGVDAGLLTFCGVGFAEKKQFGFASCLRQVASAEGVNVLIEKQSGSETRYCLTNIEYCDFAKFSIPDVPLEPGGAYSKFPSNTNILFVDIEAAKQGLQSHPIPGMLVNTKHVSLLGQEKEIVRLESTMQNLADYFEQTEAAALPTFLTRHHRHKTISAIKKMLQPEGPLLETPEGCFYDVLLNAHELLTQHCAFTLPSMPTPETYLRCGPSFLFFYHPALGPLFSLIGQKLKKGHLHASSELTLEIAEVDIQDLDLSGVLQVTAHQIMGETDAEGLLHYSSAVGRCVLHNVRVQNAGIDPAASHVYWKKQITYRERCEIFIEGDGEFCAENVTFTGPLQIVVKKGMRKIAFEKDGVLQFKTEDLYTPYLCTQGD